jgi:hypothetical protein
LILFILVVFIGLYIFWRGCMSTRKNNSSVFDIFIISSTFGIIFGRISYIINNWSFFVLQVWYWLPYEKYGEEIHLFRVLPWRFFRVWDWGIDILLMFVGFFIMATIWSLLVKKWQWSHIFPTIFFTVQAMLGIAFLLLGGSSGNDEWMVQGIVMLLIPLVMLFLKNSTNVITKKRKDSIVPVVLDIFFILISTLYISHTYLTTKITEVERGGIFLFIAWSLLGIIFYIRNSRKDYVTIEKVSSVREISPLELNQPIKLPK